MKRLLIMVLSLMLCCSACSVLRDLSHSNKSSGTTSETTAPVVNPYYRYPLNQLTEDEIRNEILEIKKTCEQSQNISEFNKSLKHHPIKIEGLSGYTLDFLDDNQYSYSDAALIDNIESIKVNVQEIGGNISFTPQSSIFFVCVFREKDRADKVYNLLAEDILQMYDVDIDSRTPGSDVWTMFVESKDNIIMPLSKYRNVNSGFYVVEILLPLVSNA